MQQRVKEQIYNNNWLIEEFRYTGVRNLFNKEIISIFINNIHSN